MKVFDPFLKKINQDEGPGNVLSQQMSPNTEISGFETSYNNVAVKRSSFVNHRKTSSLGGSFLNKHPLESGILEKNMSYNKEKSFTVINPPVQKPRAPRVKTVLDGSINNDTVKLFRKIENSTMQLNKHMEISNHFRKLQKSQQKFTCPF